MIRIKRKRKFPAEWDRELGLWITYQLRRVGQSKKSLAHTLHVRREAIVGVSYKRITSRRIQVAIANALGYQSWDELLDAFYSRKEGAA